MVARAEAAHGTIAGYAAHRAHRHQPCEPCRLAWNAYKRDRRRSEPEPGRKAERQAG